MSDQPGGPPPMPATAPPGAWGPPAGAWGPPVAPPPYSTGSGVPAEKAALRGRKAKVSAVAVIPLILVALVQVLRVYHDQSRDDGEGLGALGTVITVVATLAVVGGFVAWVLAKTKRRSAAAGDYLRSLGMPFVMDAYANPGVFAAFGAWGGGSLKRAQAVNCKVGTDGRALHLVPIKLWRPARGAQPITVDISGVQSGVTASLQVAKSVYPALALRMPPTPAAPQGGLLFLARRKWDDSGIEHSPLARFVAA